VTSAAPGYTLARAQDLLRKVVAVLMPPPDLTGSQWADRYRVLSSEDSAAPGRWSSASRPYQNEIMDVACDQTTEQVSVKGASQWGKTQCLNNIIGFYIHLDPGPIMVVNPTISMSEKWSKTRFQPMIRDCPELAALVADQKSRDSSNTILEKRFPGGLLVGVGANAPAGLASQPIRVLCEDEVDRFGDSAGTEGDPQKLAEARTVDFRGRKKIYRCSTPTIMGHSNIEEAWARSDQRRWRVACPHCGHEQTLSFWQVTWAERDWEHAVYACKGGGCEIVEPDLRRAVREGHWVADRPDVKSHAGFDVPGVMVKPMAELAKGYMEARESGPLELQVWTNTQEGALWNPRLGEDEKASALLARARQSTYTSGQVPNDVGLLVASVDLQTGDPQRLEVLVRGFGAGQEAWTICHTTITGNLLMKAPWDALEALLLRSWPRQDGGVMKIKSCALDFGGNFGKQVNAFRRRVRMRPFVYPTRGNSRPQSGHIRQANTKYLLYLMDTIGIKDEVYAGIKVTNPGFGYQHFPNDLEESYFQQLLAERPCRSKKSGRRIYEKFPADAPNEVLDLHVMAVAALNIYNPKDLADMVRKAKAVAAEPYDPVTPEAEMVVPLEVDPPSRVTDVEIDEPEAVTPEPPAIVAQATPTPVVRVIRPKSPSALTPTTQTVSVISLSVLRAAGSGGRGGGSGAW